MIINNISNLLNTQYYYKIKEAAEYTRAEYTETIYKIIEIFKSKEITNNDISKLETMLNGKTIHFKTVFDNVDLALILVRLSKLTDLKKYVSLDNSPKLSVDDILNKPVPVGVFYKLIDFEKESISNFISIKDTITKKELFTLYKIGYDNDNVLMNSEFSVFYRRVLSHVLDKGTLSPDARHYANSIKNITDFVNNNPQYIDAPLSKILKDLNNKLMNSPLDSIPINKPSPNNNPIPTSSPNNNPISPPTDTPIPDSIPTPTSTPTPPLNYNFEIPEWFENLPFGQKAIIIGGGLMLIFGFVGHGVGKILYKYRLEKVVKIAQEKYDIDAVTTINITELLYTVYNSTEVLAQFKFDQDMYLNSLYEKYKGILIGLKYSNKTKLLNDIKSQAFYYLTKDLMNKFELKSYNIHEVVYNMLNVNTPIPINKFKELMRIKEDY